jgi:formylglycine-generating enzyme required for sulfatase activity
MMRVLLTAIGLVLLLGMALSPVRAANAPVRTLPPNCGVLKNGTTFVQVFLLREWLGANEQRTVHIDGTMTITLSLDGHTAGVKIGALTAAVDEKAVQLPVAPFPQDGIYVPLRFIADAFGAPVTWDGATRQVTVKHPAGGKTLTLMVCEETAGSIAGINPKDGAAMVWVPAGPFLMGSLDGVGNNDEHPQHTVTLDGYWIYRDDVTVDRYRKFCEDTKRAMPNEPDYKWQGDNPMTNVSWDDAKAYADWAGAALPTEAQWEKAARGTDGRNFPWGGLATVEDWGNGWDTTKCACWANSHEIDTTGPRAVGSFPAGNSPYGARDMAGNVWQWCADWYGSYAATAITNPTGPATGKYHVLRGGSWYAGDGDRYRCALRGSNRPDYWNYGDFGFRCVSTSPVLLVTTAPIPPVLPPATNIIVPGTNPKDGAAMVWVPSGPFLMGSLDGVGNNDEHPQHTVTLDGYWMYRDTVTVAQYRKFCEATKRMMPTEPKNGWHDDYPITLVTWKDARAYADWAGVALPTEAQWEKAARGTTGFNYPWGGLATAGDTFNGWDATKSAGLANSVDSHGKSTDAHAVGSFPAGNSPYGARDMAGNVMQWCADWYGEGYYAVSSSSDPTGPETGKYHVMRGSSWEDSGEKYPCAHRYKGAPSNSYYFCGFRCVSLPPTPPATYTIVPGTNPKDGAAMVWVPAGPFIMGIPEGITLSADDPQHKVTLDGYWIYRDDVTVDQYRKFCEVTNRAMPNEPDFGWKGNNPMTNVTWADAVAYATWAGAALPTEAQWEKAARGTDGRNYPWGGQATVDDSTNGWDTTKCACGANARAGNQAEGPHAVGSFPAGNSPYGARDMAGNVFQWCADWYWFMPDEPATNPTGPATGRERVIRGGVWFGGIPEMFRSAYRTYVAPGSGSDVTGFRCVSTMAAPQTEP